MNIGFEVKEKIAALQAALLAQHPQMPLLLRDIHTKLQADKSVVTLLSDEEIAVVVSGLKRQTATELAVRSVSGGNKGKKGITKVTAEDL